MKKKDRERGLYGKYILYKADGSPVDPDARYFVLRLDEKGEPNHVQASRRAVELYAYEIEDSHRQLSRNLKAWISHLDREEETKLNSRSSKTPCSPSGATGTPHSVPTASSCRLSRRPCRDSATT